MSAARKRARDAADVAFRASLVTRCGTNSPPGAWRAAAATAGVSGADAFLCHLGRSIAAALESIPAKAEVARARLRSTRAALLSAVNSRCDELEARINDAESDKITALERELCAVDAVLERLREEWTDVAEAASSLGDAELAARHAELTARLDAADALLLVLPTAVVEPPYVGVEIDEAALMAGAAVFGRVVAPLAITAADLTLEGAPSYAYPGRTLLIRLAVQSSWRMSQSAEELEVSLGAAAPATHIDATLEAEGAAPQPLQAGISADTGRFIKISIDIPSVAPVGSSVCFGPLTVSGQPVAGKLGPLVVKLPCPADLSPEHAAQLQAWLPAGGSPSPVSWEEVYRATTHGFSGAAFHKRCDRRSRLLVLVRAREGGWLFGGFTAVGFIPGYERWYSDPSAFLFSLTNSLGRPEKLESKRTGEDLYNDPSWSAVFGDLYICSNADTEASSYTNTGESYPASASTGGHPMAQGRQRFAAAEIVAWVV